MRKRQIYLNGKFVPEEQAVVPVTVHALHYGTGCFEGIRAYFNEEKKSLFVFRLEDHFKRFVNSCKILMIDLGLSERELAKVVIELLEKNFSETDIYIRPLAFKSDPAVGNFNLKTLENSLVIYTTPLGRYLNQKGIRANVSSWTRVADNAIPPRGKITGAYVNTALAKTESLMAGFDEALLLDGNGHIVEGSAENVFMVKDGVIITPPLHDDILQGITRQTIITICIEELGLEVQERSIDRSEAYSADEIFLVGTGAEVSPVIELDGRKIGKGEIGKISAQARDIYFKLVHGEYGKYKGWLTEIKQS